VTWRRGQTPERRVGRISIHERSLHISRKWREIAAKFARSRFSGFYGPIDLILLGYSDIQEKNFIIKASGRIHRGVSTLTAFTRPCCPKSQRPAFIFLLWGLFFLAFSVPAAAQQAGLPTDLKTLISEALQANPAVKEKVQVQEASKEAIRPAGALDNPEVSLGLLNIPTDTFALNQVDMTNAPQLAVRQKFPFPGKRRLRSEVAEEQSKADEFSLQDKVNEIRSRVIQGYWNLALAFASYDITQKDKELWQQVVEVAETRYAVGQGMQADVLQAQVELGNYIDRLFQWQQREASITADLNALRSKPPNTTIARPQPLKPRPFNLKLDNLLKLAAEQPQLQALKSQVSKQEKAVQLAHKDFLPDFGVGVAYGFRERNVQNGLDRPDFFSGTVSLDLPIWWKAKQKPKLREQKARKAAAENAYQSFYDRAAAAIKDRYVILQRLSQQIQLYGQGIIPQARQAAEASLAAYRTGTLDFARLTQNYLAMYSAELKYQQYLKEFEGTWAELEWLVGQDLPRFGAMK
jgi:cobalt-zinc-cadmium efflux system outer membrane protein